MCNLVFRLPLPGAQAADEAPHYIIDVAEVSLPEALRVLRNTNPQRRVPREALERGDQ